MAGISNNEIKWVKSLQMKKNREQTGLFIVEGEKMLAEAMRTVTREQIAEAAGQLTLHTVFLLRAADGEEAEPDAG